MTRVSLIALAATICIAAPVQAAAPTISGKYLVTITKFCQMVNTYHFSSGTQQSIGNYLDGIDTSGSNFKQTMVAATFSPTKGTVTVSGFDDGGDIEIFQFTGSESGTLGNQIAQTPNSGKSPYSNTDTTVTIGGQVLNAMYAQVSKKGVAGYVTFQGVFANDSGDMCTEQGVAQAQ